MNYVLVFVYDSVLVGNCVYVVVEGFVIVDCVGFFYDCVKWIGDVVFGSFVFELEVLFVFGYVVF